MARATLTPTKTNAAAGQLPYIRPRALLPRTKDIRFNRRNSFRLCRSRSSCAPCLGRTNARIVQWLHRIQLVCVYFNWGSKRALLQMKTEQKSLFLLFKSRSELCLIQTKAKKKLPLKTPASCETCVFFISKTSCKVFLPYICFFLYLVCISR